MPARSATSKDSNVTVDHWLKKISWEKTTMFAIEKKIPEMVIEMRSRYPFSDMDVGDSILITEAQKAESARVAAIQFSKRHGLTWKFGLRKSREGWRVIRIA